VWTKTLNLTIHELYGPNILKLTIHELYGPKHWN